MCEEKLSKMHPTDFSGAAGGEISLAKVEYIGDGEWFLELKVQKGEVVYDLLAATFEFSLWKQEPLDECPPKGTDTEGGEVDDG